MLSLSGYSIGDIVTVKEVDYVIVPNHDGTTTMTKLNENWHNDVHEIRNEHGVFTSFVSEFLTELSTAFPHLTKTLSRKQQVEMAACLWKKYIHESNDTQ